MESLPTGVKKEEVFMTLMKYEQGIHMLDQRIKELKREEPE